MRRYFDCQDDTILGGISDRVTSETISGIIRKYDLLIQQEINGGRLSQEGESLCLYGKNLIPKTYQKFFKIY